MIKVLQHTLTSYCQQYLQAEVVSSPCARLAFELGKLNQSSRIHQSESIKHASLSNRINLTALQYD